ncbi:MAG: hypothetical protein WA791_03640, partial [Rhodomicrobium sp.]
AKPCHPIGGRRAALYFAAAANAASGAPLRWRFSTFARVGGADHLHKIYSQAFRAEVLRLEAARQESTN